MKWDYMKWVNDAGNKLSTKTKMCVSSKRFLTTDFLPVIFFLKNTKTFPNRTAT